MVSLILEDVGVIVIISQILDIIATCIPWLFHSLFHIMKSDNQFLCILPLLMKSIDLSNDISYDELKFVSDRIIRDYSIPDAISYFPIIMKKDKDLFNELFTIAIDFIQQNRAFSTQFIENYFNDFGSKFTEKFQFILDDFQNYSREKEEEKEKEKRVNYTNLIYECCILAEAKNDKVLAKSLLQKCIEYFIRHSFFGDECLTSDDKLESEETLIKACRYIVKLLDRKDTRILIFHVHLLIMTAKSQYFASCLFELAQKLIKNSCEEDRPFFIKKFTPIVEKIMSGSLKFIPNLSLVSCDIFFFFFLIDFVSNFLSIFTSFQSPIKQKIYDFVLDIVKSSVNTSYICSFLPICCNIFYYKIGTQKVYDAIIDLILYLIKNARYAALKHSIAFLLGYISELDENYINKVVNFVPTHQSWYIEEKNAECFN